MSMLLDLLLAVPEIEHVVKQNGRFTVVEKTGPDAARVGVEEDPHG